MIQQFQSLSPYVGESEQSLLSRICLALSPNYYRILDSQARTSTTTSSPFQTQGQRGILILLEVSVASGTGGLQVQLFANDFDIGNAYQAVNALPTAVTTAARFTYCIYPGAAGGAYTQATSAGLPPYFTVKVTHVDASSYTYSLKAYLLP